MNESPAPVDALVFGAGAIGLYVGGSLALAGQSVHFVARPGVAAVLQAEGLRLAALDQPTRLLSSDQFGVSTSAAEAPAARLLVLAVKGAATAHAAAELQAACAPGTPLISLQNGVDNVERIRRAAPDLDAFAGMVPFNVVQPVANEVRQTTSGRLAAQQCRVSEEWAPAFIRAGLGLDLYADMRPVQWGKLLLNLNNPLNALAGIPLLQELESRAWRRILADLQDEALAAMRAAGIRPARVTPLPSRWLPALLRLPTPLFRLLARRMLTIDPSARSSMYEDRVRGRPTEVDDLCGAVVRLAAAHGRDAPRNRALAALVDASTTGKFYAAETVASRLGDVT
ncbi:MAG: 2-dehydropantoate 2-reductase [Pseudomarimonas sp.]